MVQWVQYLPRAGEELQPDQTYSRLNSAEMIKLLKRAVLRLLIVPYQSCSVTEQNSSDQIITTRSFKVINRTLSKLFCD